MNGLDEILPPKWFEILDRNGVCTSKQIIMLSSWDIKKITNLPKADIEIIKGIVSDSVMPQCTRCDKLLEQEHCSRKVKTGCKSIDEVLKGGFRRGVITEIYGESGSGKSQIGIQAAAFNWLEGSVYICTEDLFPVRRFEQMKKNVPNYDPEVDYGKQTFVEHVTEAQDLISCIRVRLPILLSKHKICLIVIDSIAAPFRVEYSNYIQRAEELRELAILLTNIAQVHNLAILCINQVTADFQEALSVLPSLGLAWSNMLCYRLWLRKTSTAVKCYENTSSNENNTYLRTLSVEFASDLPNSTANFIITEGGVQDANIIM